MPPPYKAEKNEGKEMYFLKKKIIFVVMTVIV
jgi:hypothetical protein